MHHGELLYGDFGRFSVIAGGHPLRSNTARPISCIAYDWGISHLSQFAQDYRRLFGELPSETLRS